MDTLAKRVIWARNQRGWTQEELAKESGLAQQTINAIEGGVIVRPRKIEQLAKALNQSPAWLQFGVEAIDSLSTKAITLAVTWEGMPDHQKNAIFKMVSEMAKNPGHK